MCLRLQIYQLNIYTISWQEPIGEPTGAARDGPEALGIQFLLENMSHIFSVQKQKQNHLLDKLALLLVYAQASIADRQAQLRAEMRKEAHEKSPPKPGRKPKQKDEPKGKGAKGKGKGGACASVAKAEKKTSKGSSKSSRGRSKGTPPAEAASAAGKRKRAENLGDAVDRHDKKPKGSGKDGGGKEGEDLSKIRADKAYEKMLNAQVCKMPKIGNRKSFTVQSGDRKLSNIGVVLYNESFYVGWTIPAETWPECCSHLKVPDG